ncbi:hypothetical protein BJ138DRAFT_1127993 [Hygrophoropsis aurantiaca]|uniref:Uncharacterized protein n=1 Tax=Hygrophoropsis aurantiaca TaxID=72124 RepID=A0ACB8A7H7_9AGAM|nr:hypothetical protein BJ138DRAFT_1127993 [Hygrophoropsis aurantiaca]
MAYPQARRRQPKPRSDNNRDSTLVRASVLETALELGVAHNSTVANWIFNNPLAEGLEDESEPVWQPKESQRATPTLILGSNTTSDESSSLSSPQTYVAASVVQTPVIESPTMPHIHFDDVKPLEPLTPSLSPSQKTRPEVYESDEGKSKKSGESTGTWARKLQPNRKPADDSGYLSEGQYLTDEKTLGKQSKEKSKTKPKSTPTTPKKQDSAKAQKQSSPNPREGSTERGYVSDGGYMSASSSKSKGSKKSKAMSFFRRKNKNKGGQQDSDDEDDRIPPVPPMPLPAVPSSPKPLRHHPGAAPSSPTRTGFYPLSLPFSAGSTSVGSSEMEKRKGIAPLNSPRPSDTSSKPPSLTLSPPPTSKFARSVRPIDSPNTPLSVSIFPPTPLSAATFPGNSVSASTLPNTPISASGSSHSVPRLSFPSSRHGPPPAPPPNQPLPQLPPSPSRPVPSRPIPALPSAVSNSVPRRVPSPSPLGMRGAKVDISPPRSQPFPPRPIPPHSAIDPFLAPIIPLGRFNADGTARRYNSSATESNVELRPAGHQHSSALRKQRSDAALDVSRNADKDKELGKTENQPEPDFVSNAVGARTTPPPYSQKQVSLSHGLPSSPHPNRRGFDLPQPPPLHAIQSSSRPSERDSKFHEHLSSVSSNTLAQILNTPLTPRRPPSNGSGSNRTHSSEPSSVSRQSSSEQSFGQVMRSSQSSYGQPSAKPSFTSTDLDSLRRLEQGYSRPVKSSFHDSDSEDDGGRIAEPDDDDASFYPSDEKTAGRRTMYLVENGGESGDFDEDSFDFSLGAHMSSR